MAIHRCRLIAALQLALGDLPDHVTGDLAQLQWPNVRIEAATDPPYVSKTPKMLLAQEIPDHGLLPGALRLDPEIRLAKRLQL